MDREKLELLRSLISLYLLLAAIDGKFDNVEEFTIREKINEWDADLTPELYDKIFRESVKTLKDGDQNLILNNCAGLLNHKFDEDNKINVLKDLIAIAISDGKINENEKIMLNFLAETWELSNDIDIDEYTRQVAIDLLNSSPEDYLRAEGFSEEEIRNLEIDDLEESTSDLNEEESSFTSVEEPGKAVESEQLEEIIAEVYKDGSNYRAKIKDTEYDITDLVNNPAKLKYAFERSGLVKGKKNKNGSYKWRVISKQ